jgi:SAM-dependent methyltransferase
VYAEFYAHIRARLARRPAGAQDVEIGSGPGTSRQFLPECVATDLVAHPWIDRVENAYALTFPPASVANLILLDVWHHLRYPANFLAQAARVLTPGGRVIILEPAMSGVGRLVYGGFHHEPLGFDQAFAAAPVDLREHDGSAYFAAQSSAHRLLWRRELPALLAGWHTAEVEWITSFAYLASGGFTGVQLYPLVALPWLRVLDRFMGRWPRLCAARLLVVLAREGEA